MARRVLITGVSRHLGGRLAQILAAAPDVDVVVGVDTVAPQGDLGRTEFVRADIRNPIIAKVISTARIDTVVHMNLIATPARAGGRTAMKEINVIGTMQLLAACQKAPRVRRLVLKSRPRSTARPRGTRRCSPRTRQPRGGRVRLRQGRGRGRGLRARLRPAPPRRRAHACCGSPTSSARTSTARSRATCRCRWCRPCSATTRASSSATRTTRWRCCAAARPTTPARQRRRRGVSCCCRRRSAAPGGSRSRCRPRRSASWAICCGGPSWSTLARADALPRVRPGRRRQPAARGLRLHAALHDAAGVRRLGGDGRDCRLIDPEAVAIAERAALSGSRRRRRYARFERVTAA